MLLRLGLLMSGDTDMFAHHEVAGLPDHRDHFCLPDEELDLLHHLAFNSPSAATRSWAQDRLAGSALTEDRIRILAELHAHDLVIGPALSTLLDERRALDRRLPLVFSKKRGAVLCAALLWALVVAGLGLLVFPRSRSKGPALLILTGSLMAYLQIEPLSTALLPAQAGWCVAAFGAWLLIPLCRSSWRWHPALVFTLTALLSFLSAERSDLAVLPHLLTCAEWAAVFVIFLLCRLQEEELRELPHRNFFGGFPIVGSCALVAIAVAISAITARVFNKPDLALALGCGLVTITLAWGLVALAREPRRQDAVVPFFFMLVLFPVLFLQQGWAFISLAAETPVTGLVAATSPFVALTSSVHLSLLVWLLLLVVYGSFHKKRERRAEIASAGS